MNRQQLKENIFFNYVIDNKFKTNRISINLITNIDENTATEYALLSFVLCRGNKNYPKYIDFTKKLNDLYGADFNCSIDKVSGKHILSMSISAIDSKFSLYSEDIVAEATNFLLDTLLEPNFNENHFIGDVIKIEKSKLKEAIESVLNDKREYTRKKAKSLLFKGSKLAISKYGDINRIDKITKESLTKAYYNLLNTSKIELTFIGCGDFNSALKVCTSRLKDIESTVVIDDVRMDFSTFNTINKSEELDITQSKISILYTGFNGDGIERVSIMRMANAIFGGSPFSKLFVNVREKKSLCYYCDSFYDRTTGVMSVDCGVNPENIQVAIDTINEQLRDIKNGEITDKEVNEAKLLIINAFNSMKDRLSSIEGFYLGQILTGKYYTIDEHINYIKNVTNKDVIDAFSNCELKVIYTLKSKDGE